MGEAIGMHGVRVLFDTEIIEQKVKELGEQISRDYGQYEAPLCVVGVLKGATIFLADLIRAIDEEVALEVHFIEASSYGSGTESSGEVTIKRALEIEITGKHVLLIDDILDTGQTLHSLIESLNERNPASVKVCVLLNKRSRRIVEVPEVCYCGFEIEDGWVLGYGMDLNQRYRNLPYIGVAEFE